MSEFWRIRKSISIVQSYELMVLSRTCPTITYRYKKENWYEKKRSPKSVFMMRYFVKRYREDSFKACILAEHME